MKQLPERWGPFFASKPETAMGIHTGNVTLLDGRTYEDVIFDSGHVARVRGFAAIPFEVAEISAIQITGRRWPWLE
jgi:hypothetical protein